MHRRDYLTRRTGSQIETAERKRARRRGETASHIALAGERRVAIRHQACREGIAQSQARDRGCVRVGERKSHRGARSPAHLHRRRIEAQTYCRCRKKIRDRSRYAADSGAHGIGRGDGLVTRGVERGAEGPHTIRQRRIRRQHGRYIRTGEMYRAGRNRARYCPKNRWPSH